MFFLPGVCQHPWDIPQESGGSFSLPSSMKLLMKVLGRACPSLLACRELKLLCWPEELWMWLGGLGGLARDRSPRLVSG